MISRKDYCRKARGVVRHGATQRSLAGVMFVDINDGYHERHTRWRWAAGAGRVQHGRLVAFNTITGLHDDPVNSERTIWVDGEEGESGPVAFSDDLSAVSFADGGELRFRPEALIVQHTNLPLGRCDYLHWFGVYMGTLPGGIELEEAPASASATTRSGRGGHPALMLSYSGATTPANRSRSVISNVSAAALGSVGVQPGFCFRYDNASPCSKPMNTSATIRPPTGPNCFPSSPTSASRRM